MMPLAAASSCRTLLSRQRLYMVLRTWLDISRKWAGAFFILALSRAIKSSMACAAWSDSRVVESMERFLMNFSMVIW